MSKLLKCKIYYGFPEGGGYQPFSSYKSPSQVKAIFLRHFKSVFPFENAKLIEFRYSDDRDLRDNEISPYWIRFVLEFENVKDSLYLIYYAKDETNCSKIRSVIQNAFDEN